MTTRYLVWVDGDTRADAKEINAVGPCIAAETWLKDREFGAGDDSDIHEIVTVVEDKEGSPEERFNVFCDVSITFTAHRINYEIS